MSRYNPWPLGKPIIERPEPEIIKEYGYKWSDPRDIIEIFENKVSKFAGSKYAVAVDSCSHALFLSARYLIRHEGIPLKAFIPRNTYISVLHQLRHAGLIVHFDKRKWTGVYQVEPTRIWDASVRWTKGMYIKDSLMCLSFQHKKRIPIGRGGIILCSTKKEYEWLKLASYDGRDLKTTYDSPGHVKMQGYHYYMTPEDAARGILLMDATPEVNPDSGGWENYPDICTLQQ